MKMAAMEGLRALQRPATNRPPESVKSAAKGLEAMVFKQLLEASGAFKTGAGAGAGRLSGPGSQIRMQMLLDSIADAVAKSGGLGIAESLTRHLSASAAAANYMTDHSRAAPDGSLMRAIRGDLVPAAERITSRFGPRADPLHRGHAHHNGIDIAAAKGSVIQVPQEGVVTQAGNHRTLGNYVRIRHPNGMETLFAHAEEISVKKGEAVIRGQILGKVGDTGRATGPHLHLEVRQNGRSVDPAQALIKMGKRADIHDEAARMKL